MEVVGSMNGRVGSSRFFRLEPSMFPAFQHLLKAQGLAGQVDRSLLTTFIDIRFQLYHKKKRFPFQPVEVKHFPSSLSSLFPFHPRLHSSDKYHPAALC